MCRGIFAQRYINCSICRSALEVGTELCVFETELKLVQHGLHVRITTVGLAFDHVGVIYR